jgi:acetolactate synthase regulatory subunit
LSDHVLCPPAGQQLGSLRLSISATNLAEVLMPVMSTVHRRRCRVLALAYTAADDQGRGHLELSLACPSARLQTVPRWLANIVGVLDVEVLA